MSITRLLIVLNVILFGVMLLKSSGLGIQGFDEHMLLEFGALYAPLVRDGHYWRLLTTTFLHINLIHVAMNMLALYQIGPIVESAYGGRRFALLYLVAGLGGSVGSLGWHWHSEALSAGASGALSGLVTCGAVMGHKLHTESGRVFRNAMLRWAGLIMVFGLFVHADHAAHLGGMITGAFLAAFMRTPFRRGAPLIVEAAVIIILVGACFVAAGLHRNKAQFVGEVINQGVEHAERGDYVGAEVQYRRAIRMDPGEVLGHYNLALALAQIGKIDEAIAEIHAALALDPTYEAALSLQKSLSRNRPTPTP